MTSPTAAPVPLVERKRRLVQQRIVEAADELFSERGFDQVSVTDIAARADVGRTTFFRYFGDKQEVVFAKEQQLLATITAAAQQDSPGAAGTAGEALEQLRPIVLDVCEQATTDPEAYERHCRLVDHYLELRGRDALKMQHIAVILSELLVRRGTEATLAVFAAQVALACYQTARLRSGSGRSLTDETRAAFDEALALGQRPAATGRG